MIIFLMERFIPPIPTQRIGIGLAAVARMERRGIRALRTPDSATLHPGYSLLATVIDSDLVQFRTRLLPSR